MLQGFLIPILNTTLIELTTAADLRDSFIPRLILRLNLLTLFRSRTIYSPPGIVGTMVCEDFASPGNK